MTQTKFKIGEFSRLGRVTVRTLRHYEKIGLLKPEIVDMWTGYRYYSPGQLQKLLSIVQLKQLGFSLAEIMELYENDTHYPDIGTLESKIKTCEEELQMLTIGPHSLTMMPSGSTWSVSWPPKWPGLAASVRNQAIVSPSRPLRNTRRKTSR